MKKFIYLGVMLLLCFNFISASPPVTTVQQFADGYIIAEAQQSTIKMNSPYSYHFFLYNISNGNDITDLDGINCSIFIANTSGSILFNSDVKSITPDNYWEVNITEDVFSYAGEYSYGVNCQNSYGGALAGTFYANYTGNETNLQQVFIYILLITLFFGGIVGFYIINRNIDYEKWYKKVYAKFQKRNFVKATMSSVLYGFLKDGYAVYYFLGFGLLTTVLSMVLNFNIVFITPFIEGLLVAYSIGIIVIGAVFLGKIQTLIKSCLDSMKQDNWGMNEQ